MSGTDDERRIRLLLERAVPHLAAPAERMRQVRQRVVRRRRRRAALGAGVTAVAALAVVVASLSLGQPSLPRRPAALPASVASPPRGAPPVVSEPTRGPTPEGNAPSGAPGSAVRFAAVGLTLHLPPGWYAGQAPQTSAAEAGFVTDQRPVDSGGCGATTAASPSCGSVPALAEDGVLISFGQGGLPDGVVKKLGDSTFTFGAVSPADPDCAALGGDTSMTAVGKPVTSGHQRVAVNARVCFRAASNTTLAQVKGVLSTAVRDDGQGG